MYRELLEEEMKKSEEFSRKNFGQQVAPDFPEFAKDVANNQALSATLLIELVMIGMVGGKEVADSMRELEKKPDFKMSDAVLANLNTFKTPLSLLYWGIQIGRKLEREKKEVSDLEKLFGEKEK